MCYWSSFLPYRLWWEYHVLIHWNQEILQHLREVSDVYVTHPLDCLPSTAYMRQWTGSVLVQIMARRLFTEYWARSHYLIQCWLCIDWTTRNKLQWSSNQDTKIFIHQNACENALCEMGAIWSSGWWVNSFSPSATYMSQWIGSASAQIMACRLFGAKPLSYITSAGLLSIGPLETNISEILIQIQNFSFTKMHLKISSAKRWPFCPWEMG